MTLEKHQISIVIRGNNIYHKCDECGELILADKTTKITKGSGEFAYCESCMKKLYPNYRKVYIQNFNSKIAREMRDTLARKEYRR